MAPKEKGTQGGQGPKPDNRPTGQTGKDPGTELPPEIMKLANDSRIVEILDNLMPPASDKDISEDAAEFRDAVIALKEATRKREANPSGVKYATKEDRRDGRTVEMIQAIERIQDIIYRQETGSDVPDNDADKVKQGAVDFMAYTASAQAVDEFYADKAQESARQAARHQAKPHGITHDPGHNEHSAGPARHHPPARHSPTQRIPAGQTGQDLPQAPPPGKPRNR
jgi:hypothetical protein